MVREQGRAAARWQASCVADDTLRRRIARLAEDPLVVCREAIGPSDVERVVGLAIVMHAHEACYKLWREESNRDARLTRLAS